ncbi:hypothetical protein [Ileibacterium valens]|uniref:hypothetical protein n=1 Tax=Ileibacterium valens TaxID=1862668 RepID=UPI00273028E2|nr:hypothetical protein [Ileibacterium valens]
MPSGDIDRFIDACKDMSADMVKDNLERYRKAGTLALKDMREQVYSNYRLGGKGQAFDSRRSSIDVYQKGMRATITLEAWADPDKFKAPDAARWMREHESRFGLGAKYGSAGQYVLGHLIAEEGIIGLPAVGTWQNEQGLSPATPGDRAYLMAIRKNPWVNPSFIQTVPLNIAVEDPGILGQFPSLVTKYL